jgi:hypothetical protein
VLAIADTMDAISVELHAWAARETAQVRAESPRRVPIERQMHHLSDRIPNLRLYHFAERNVVLQPRPAGLWSSPFLEQRALSYLTFFQTVAVLLPDDLCTTLCVCLGDMTGRYNVPLFGFQKKHAGATLLMPDIDFLVDDFHEGEFWQDNTPYAQKMPRAVFAGSTTGAIIDAEMARNCSLPRLRAARFFQNRVDVDFRLPHVAQYEDDEARTLMAAQPFCQRPPLSWHEQFQSRFLISIDGNGATCARIAVGLASHCVLLKYASDQILYYFPALKPHVHYVPIERDEDVLAVLAAERAAPGRHAAISQAARRFAADYLTRNRITEYMARLIVAYAGCLQETEAPAASDPPVRLAAGARGADGSTDLNEQHDWVGKPGSGVKLAAFKVLTQPRTEAPRLLYQALLDDGRFTATMNEGTWCGGDDPAQALAGIRLENARGAARVAISVEARFTDGSEAYVDTMGAACCSPSGAPMEAFRVRFA